MNGICLNCKVLEPIGILLIVCILNMTGVSDQEHRQTRDESSLNFKLGDESFESLGNIGRKGTVHIMNSSAAMEQH